MKFSKQATTTVAVLGALLFGFSSFGVAQTSAQEQAQPSAQEPAKTHAKEQTKTQDQAHSQPKCDVPGMFCNTYFGQ